MQTVTTLTATTTRRLRLRGRVDAHVVGNVRSQFRAQRTGNVDLDLDEVRFLDGAALAAIEDEAVQLRAAGHTLRVTAASTAATVIMELATAAGILSRGPLLPTTMPAPVLAVAA